MIRIPEYLERRRAVSVERPSEPDSSRRAAERSPTGGPAADASVIAPDSFKGSLTSVEVAGPRRRLARGPARRRVLLAPLADGGEGTLDAIEAAGGWEWRTADATDPLGRPIAARWLRSADGERARRRAGRGVRAVAARAGGARPARRVDASAPARSSGPRSTRASARSPSGSAAARRPTAARGSSRALGARVDRRERDGRPGAASIRGSPSVELRIACDVTNPLLGPTRRGRDLRAPEGRDARARSPSSTPRSRATPTARARRPGATSATTPGAGAAGGTGVRPARDRATGSRRSSSCRASRSSWR